MVSYREIMDVLTYRGLRELARLLAKHLPADCPRLPDPELATMLEVVFEAGKQGFTFKAVEDGGRVVTVNVEPDNNNVKFECRETRVGRK